MIVAAAMVGGALYFVAKNPVIVGQKLGSAAVDMAEGVLVGSVETIGESIGIPRTNVAKGQSELDAGNYWDASFDLPAGDFIKGVWKKWTD